MCFPPARKCAFRHSSPVLVLTYPVVKLVDGHVLVIVIFYSCGGFNTPTPLEASLRGCVVTKGIKADCNHLMRTTYPDACVGGVDYTVSIRVPHCLVGHTFY